MGQAMEPVPGFEPLRPPRRKWPWIVAAVVVMVAVVGGVFATRVIAVTRTAYADVMPPDTVAFAHLDFLRIVQNERIEDLVTAFEDVAPADSDVPGDLQEAMDQLDEQMFEQLGFTMTEDVMPWVGRGMGIGLLTVEVGDAPADIPNIEWIASVDVRDGAALEAFMPALEDAISAEFGELGLTTYEGVSIRTWESGGVEYAVGPGDKVLFIGSGADAIRRAITAQGATSLSDVAAFQSATEQLPDDRFFTMYASGDEYARLIEDVMDDTGIALEELGYPFELSTFESASFAATLNDNGFKFDGYTLMRPEHMEEWMVMAWRNNPERFVPQLPADTQFYMGTRNGPGLYADAYLAAFIAGDPGAEEALDGWRTDIAAEIGFDPLDDFISLLDGETAWVVIADENSSFADEFGPFAFGAFIGTSDDARLGVSVATLVELFAGENDGTGGLIIEPAEAHPDLWEITVDGEPLIFGVTDQVLLGASSDELVSEVIDGGGAKLVDTPRYRAARNALPDDVSMRFYLDLHGFADSLAESLSNEESRQVEEVLRNVTAIAGGSGGDERIRHWSAVMVIDY